MRSFLDLRPTSTGAACQVQLLVRAYQVRGHHVADLDPLGILDPDLNPAHPPELELSRYGFTERDLDKQITLGPGILPHFATEDRKTMSLGEIIGLCKRIYCEYCSGLRPILVH